MAGDDQRAGILDGLTLHVSSPRLGARFATLLLRNLGAEVIEVAPTEPADLADAGSALTPDGLELSAFGTAGRFCDAPDRSSAVLAVGGASMGEYSYRPGPVYQVTPFGDIAQGLLGATAILARRLCAALPEHEVPGHLSTLQALFALQVGGYVYGPVADELRWTHSPRGQWPSYATYRASDGQWLFTGASTTPFMIRLLQALELDEILADPRTHEGPRSLDAEITGRMWTEVEERIAQRPGDHWIKRVNDFGVPIGPVLPIEEALRHPQLRAEELVDDDLNLTNLVRVAKRCDGPPPPGTRGPLPLSGLRVLELTGYIAGAYTGRLLADLGADVVKVEPPGGDPFRSLGYGFAGWNYAKRGLTLDVSTTEGRQAVLDLASVADIFVTNYRAESLQKLGLSREEIVAVNPTVIHCAISAFGTSGPLARMPGFDPIVQGFIGVMRRQGGDGDPAKTQMPATDYMSAMLATLGIISARTRQVAEGGGYNVNTSLLAAATCLLFDAVEAIREGRPYLRGGRDFEGPHPLERLYEADDGWLLVTTPPEEREQHPEAIAYLGGVRDTTVEAAIAHLAELGIDAVPAIHPLHLTEEPHFRDNRLWTSFTQGELGELTLPAPVFRRSAVDQRAPELGESAPLEDWWADVRRHQEV